MTSTLGFWAMADAHLASSWRPASAAPPPTMLVIILCAGHYPELDEELAQADDRQLIGTHKGLIPIGGRPVLQYWWELVRTRDLVDDKVFLVCSATHYKHYERWATSNDFPVENIVNDGTTSNATSIGAAGDIEMVLRTKDIKDKDVMVLSGDSFFYPTFDLKSVLSYYYQIQEKEGGGNVAIYYELKNLADRCRRGIVDVDPGTNRITSFEEKPSDNSKTSSSLACPVFYIFTAATLPLISKLVEESAAQSLSRASAAGGMWSASSHMSAGALMDQLCAQSVVYGMQLSSNFELIGQSGLASFREWDALVQRPDPAALQKRTQFTCRAYARTGLMGNPSDGFNGKTISVSVKNFWVDVTMWESETLVILPHPIYDPQEFGGLADLNFIGRKEGYYGGMRLLMATCKKFYDYATAKGLALPKKNFTLRYETNIPRQVGLAGSSAIISATLRCLRKFYGISDRHLPKSMVPTFCLSVEVDELFINAGLQDRVIQEFEGVMYMDFDKDHLATHGCGRYERIPSAALSKFCPLLFLAYQHDPSDSGKIHSDVKQRWLNGEKEVVDAMAEFGRLSDQARTAILDGDKQQLATLMDANFNLRRKIYGDPALGAKNLRMIEIARQHQAACKFPGSGGAVVGLASSLESLGPMRHAFEAEGCVFTILQINTSPEEVEAAADM